MIRIEKVILILLITSLLWSFILPNTIRADELTQGKSKYTNYVAIGDSIAAGYGLENISKDSYAQIIRAHYNIDEKNFSNKGVVGATCEDYYHFITDSGDAETYRNLIKNADLITVSVGSNEILGLIVKAIADGAGVDVIDADGNAIPTLTVMAEVQEVFANGDAAKKAEIIASIVNFFSSEETIRNIDSKVNSYKDYWDKIVKEIKELNPDAVIIATEFYNPYYGVKLGTFDVGEFTDDAINKMNEALEQRSNSESDYKIARIYESFNTKDPRVTNVNFNILESKINLDPHPNKQGHSIIATKVIDVADKAEPKKDLKKDITTLSISKILDYTYTGNAIEPKVTIKDNGIELKEGKDYTITYSNNKEIGEATVTITGIGNYTGMTKKSFKIIASSNNNDDGLINNTNNKKNTKEQIQNSNSSNKRLPDTGTPTIIIGMILIISIILVTITRNELKK